MLQTAYQQGQTEGSVTTNQKERSSLKMGFIDKGTGEHQSNQVFSKNGSCPTIPAVSGAKEPLKIIDKT